MRNFLFTILFTFSCINFATAATLEDCAKLLPDGHKYTIEIIMEVDKEVTPPAISGSFDVAGGSDSTERFDIGNFVECAAPLIKSVETDNNLAK